VNVLIATNMEQIEAEFKKRLLNAAKMVSEGIEATMKKEMADFYTQGNPVMYERTGALGETSRVSGIKNNDTSVEFEAYLDQTHKYTTGTWGMAEVQENAENGTGGILGKSGFWERTKSKIPNEISNACNKVL